MKLYQTYKFVLTSSNQMILLQQYRLFQNFFHPSTHIDPFESTSDQTRPAQTSSDCQFQATCFSLDIQP